MIRYMKWYTIYDIWYDILYNGIQWYMIWYDMIWKKGALRCEEQSAVTGLQGINVIGYRSSLGSLRPALQTLGVKTSHCKPTEQQHTQTNSGLQGDRWRWEDREGIPHRLETCLGFVSEVAQGLHQLPVEDQEEGQRPSWVLGDCQHVPRACHSGLELPAAVPAQGCGADAWRRQVQ